MFADCRYFDFVSFTLAATHSIEVSNYDFVHRCDCK
jgi:hypothetical protein